MRQITSSGRKQLESQENIMIGVRLKYSDTQDKAAQIIDERTIKMNKTNERFAFGIYEMNQDRVFGEHSQSQDIFQGLIKPVINSFLQGYNGSICAYGQTSTGKTYTMKGNSEHPGLIPLTVAFILEKINENQNTSYQFRISYLELYNEMVFDLLTPGKNQLDVRDQKGALQLDMKQELLSSYDDFLKYFNYGEDQRSFGETKMNENSSRSHVILQLTLEGRQKVYPYTQTHSTLHMVDLAGSEGVSKTQAEGQRRKEGCSINRSLLALQNVVKSLRETSKGKYVNFRDSKLTRLLQNSLSGNSMTIFLLTLSQLNENFNETINAIRFGMAAGAIKTNLKLSNINSQEDVEEKAEYQNFIQNLQDQIENLNEEKNIYEKRIIELGQSVSDLGQKNQNLNSKIQNLTQQLESTEQHLRLVEQQAKDAEHAKKELVKKNLELSQFLDNQICWAKERGIYKSSLIDSQTQTDIQALEEVSFLDSIKTDGHLNTQPVCVNKQTKQDTNQTPVKPTLVQFQQTSQNSQSKDIQNILLKSMQKHNQYMRALHLNTELQSELMQKSKELLNLKRALEEKERLCRMKDQQLFNLREQNMINNNDVNQQVGTPPKLAKFKKRVVNSPSKDELKKILQKQDCRIKDYMRELERYQKNFEQISTDKENLLQFSQHVYETLMSHNILPDF